MDPYDNSAVLMMTERCNSNCIMCPMSIDARRKGRDITDRDLDSLLDSIEDDVRHIDITGGEPFLKWEQVLHAMDVINARWPDVPVLVLTNGRALSLPFLQEAIHPRITEHYQFAIPLHGPDAVVHDHITQTEGSFQQTLDALRFLAHTEARIEIRIVGHRENVQWINKTCEMIVEQGIRADVVNLIAMEMNGRAAYNRDKLWIDYDQLYQRSEKGLLHLIAHAIDVGLYDFPLCALPRHAWPLAKHSISLEKIRYPDACDACAEKKACGGLFKSTYLLGLCPVHPYDKENDQ